MAVENFDAPVDVTSSPIARVAVLKGVSLRLQQLLCVAKQIILFVGRGRRVLFTKLHLPKWSTLWDVFWRRHLLVECFPLVENGKGGGIGSRVVILWHPIN